ncbi:MAG TPA: site-2 protease family protein [Acidimicrobiia bacterium]|nr:site-2 protease family protein [Acidimicrobiia bacterium]
MTASPASAPDRPGRGISLGSWFGVPVRIDVSWFFIAFLIAWSFFTLYSARFPQLAEAAIVLMGIATAIVFFVSVLLHELSHSVMARRLGLPVQGITLFIFGGVTETGSEAKTAGTEFAVAIVGPLTSLALAAVFWSLVNLTGEILPASIRYGLGHLGWLNLGLGLFNLLPGFPLDGGRVLRSAVWRVSGDMDRATRTAATGGKIVAGLMIAFGFLAIAGGNLGGLWYAAIGWFLYQAAGASGQAFAVRRLFEGVLAGDLMSPHLVTMPADLTLQEAVDDYFFRFDHSGFPVTDDEGATIGILTLRAVRQVPRDQWPVRQAWSAMTRLPEVGQVPPDTPVEEVLALLEQDGEQRILVVDGGEVAGIITPRDVTRWVRRARELGVTGPDSGP